MSLVMSARHPVAPNEKRRHAWIICRLLSISHAVTSRRGITSKLYRRPSTIWTGSTQPRESCSHGLPIILGHCKQPGPRWHCYFRDTSCAIAVSDLPGGHQCSCHKSVRQCGCSKVRDYFSGFVPSHDCDISVSNIVVNNQGDFRRGACGTSARSACCLTLQLPAEQRGNQDRVREEWSHFAILARVIAIRSSSPRRCTDTELPIRYRSGKLSS
jgi:hypothetical protein